MARFNEIVSEASRYPIDFLLIYIEEAHPTDGWIFEKNRYKIRQPVCLEERIAAAKQFAADTSLKCPILVDNMHNEANEKYGALPERLYIIFNGIIIFEGEQGPAYDLEKMRRVLIDFCSRVVTNSCGAIN